MIFSRKKIYLLSLTVVCLLIGLFLFKSDILAATFGNLGGSVRGSDQGLGLVPPVPYYVPPSPSPLPGFDLNDALRDYQQMKIDTKIGSQGLFLTREQNALLRTSWWQTLKEWAKKLNDELVIRGGKIFYKNALRVLFSRLAYNTATYLASGDVGKKPLFETKQLGDFVVDVAETAFIDTLTLLGDTNGFFNFNVCQPGDINLRLAIHYSLFGNFNGRGPRGAPRCTFRELSENWDQWLSANFGSGSAIGSTENFLQAFKGAFSPIQTDVGIYIKLDSSIRSRIVDAETKALFDRANRDIKAVTEPITGFIRTPVPITDAGARALATDGPIPETVTTGDIVADSIGIFTNTLAAKLIEQAFKKGLTGGSRAQSTIAFNWVNQEIQRAQANQVFANLAEFHPTSGFETVLESLSQCQNPQNPRPTECVFNPNLGEAIEQGLTVKEALANRHLRADGLVGHKANGQLTYMNDYPYRSLVIMRIHRILPVGWEQAALYNIQTEREVTLQQIVDCYEDKNHPTDPKYPEFCSDMNGDGTVADDEYNPYYHLIDPNWVLTAPESYCARKGFGNELTSAFTECSQDNVPNTTDPANNNELVEGPACESSLNNPDIPVLSVTRSDDYCADRQSCLFVNDQGECAGEYGYCLKEQELTRFPQATSCQPQYNTCETLTRKQDNQSFSYLKNTLKPCNASDAGCLWYSTSQSKVNLGDQVGWQWSEADESKIYLNGSAKSCDASSGGCTKLTRMIPGVNGVVNGDFSSALTDTWQGNCISQESNEGVNGSGLKLEVEGAACAATTAGFIPVDPAYDYILTGAYKSGANHSAGVSVNYYPDASNNNGRQELNQALPSPNSSWQRFSFELNDLNPAARYVKVILEASGAEADFYFDDIQLVINRSPIVKDNLENFSVNPERYQTDYSHNDSYARTYLKQAPDYLDCNLYNEVDRAARYAGEEGQQNCVSDGKYWRSDIRQCVRGGDASCAGYAAVCQAHEVGCQGYKPLNGDPEVSAVAGQGDVCPAECVGYDSYLELPTYFDKTENPDATAQTQNFIPETAQTCRAIDAGCEQFTNLDEVAKGGEGIEYFTKLKQCVSPNNANIKTYYTWEGSDTTGYQLKKWEFLASKIILEDHNGAGPCTNIAIGSEECADTENNMALCSQEDIDAGNADCRHFFNSDNEPFFVLQDRAINASNSCRPYRRTLTGEIYNADPAEGKSCSVAVNGCREYKGNRGNNIRNILTDKFERNAVGEWQNTSGSTAGLTISNEAIYQGGHSLLVAVNNTTVNYPLTGKLTTGKDYLLSFWAKKGNGNKITPRAGDPQVQIDLLNFTLNGANLSGDWVLQTIGPIQFVSTGQNTAKLALTVQNLGNDEVFYLDNVILKEYTNSFYAIKNSWTTPASCDAPTPGAFLGCGAYVDRQQQTQFLKGFSNLCSNAAIGCEAFLDTRNSTAFQAAHTYNDQTTVPNDRVVYLVNDPKKQCVAEKQGCQLLGQPILDRQSGEPGAEPVIGWNNTYKINNPDLYASGQGSILCNPEVLFCSAFKGETSGSVAYFDPQLSAGSGANTVKGCYYSNGNWYKNGGTEACPGAYTAGNVSYIPSFNQVGYKDWVGFCPQNQSTCTQYRNPNQPDQGISGNQVEQCDAKLSPAWQGVCVVGQNGAEDNEGYCNLEISGVRHDVCRLSGSSCFYSSYDWTCPGTKAAYYTADDDVPDGLIGQLKPDTGNCEIDLSDGKKEKVCFIPQNSDTSDCKYSLLCQSSSYLKNSIDKEATCNEVDRNAGCLLFNDTSIGNYTLSNNDSKDGFPASQGNFSAAFGQSGYQDANTIIKVKKDRQCGEWLECKTGFEQPKANASGGNEFVCLDLYRCSQKGEGDNVCSKIVSTSQDADQVYNLSADGSITEIDQIKNLSGYSHPGLKWNNDIQTIGFKSPEQALQKGQSMSVINGGFETYLGSDLSQPEGWLAATKGSNSINSSYTGDNPPCQAVLDQTPANVRSGHYSLRLNLNGDRQDDDSGSIYCDFRSDAGLNSGYYQVNQNSNYNLSFWAKSENGGQGINAALVFFDVNNNHLTVLPGTPNVDWRLGARPPTQWKKYLISYGPDTDHLIPGGAVKMRIFFYNYTSPAQPNVFKGSVWFDDFAIEPTLNLNANLSVAKDCRLYPTEDAPACAYQGLSSRYEGWQGYCLEPDPAYQVDPLNPNNFQNCLQWYPVDSLLGDRLSVFSTQNIGYTDRSPLYYCAQTAGNYNKVRYTENPYDSYPIPGPQNSNLGYKFQSLLHIRNINYGEGERDECTNEDGSDNLWVCQGSSGSVDWEAGCVLNDDYCSQFNNNEDACAGQSDYCTSETRCVGWTVEPDGHRECVRTIPICSNKDISSNQCATQRADSCSGPCTYSEESNTQGREPEGGKYANIFYYGQWESNAVTLGEIGAIEFKLNDYEGYTCDRDQNGFFSDVTDSLDSIDNKFFGWVTRNNDTPVDITRDYYKKFDKVFLYSVDCNASYSVLLAFGKKPNSTVSRLLRIETNFTDDGDGAGGISANIYYYLKDRCSLIAQTVKLEGGVVKEKSWLGRLSNWVSNNILGFGKQTSEQPYGSFYPPKSSTPEYWSKPGPNDRKDAPLYVYSGGSFDFGPSAGTPWSVPVGSAITPQAPGRVCVSSTNSSILGKECKTSSDCQGGVCSGVGKFCYNQQGISNGTACKGSGDCPNPNDFTCSYPKETEESPFATTPGVAIDRLQQLFAKVYGVWKWSNAAGKYELCDAYENGSINCNLGDDFTADISGTGRDNSASVDDVTVLGGNILAVPGGKVELNFTVNGSADQLPLDGIWIDWQDGNVEYFKGPFGYKPNLALPYKAYHVYTCYTNEQGNQCVACTNSPAVNGQCDYGTPLVNVKNHWGWCSNTGPFRGQGQVSQWVDEADCDPANGTPADKSVIIE